jgi:hypothetical protein
MPLNLTVSTTNNGSMQEPALGAFRFMSGKPGGQNNSNGSTSVSHVGCIAHMYVLHVLEELDVWPEAHERQRLWVGGSAAGAMQRVWPQAGLLLEQYRHMCCLTVVLRSVPCLKPSLSAGMTG